ncbi:MAG TPA: hypothetical protein PLK08_02770 [Phycisphaerae bacterium]|nr:hypothetical protein [Phycisphaerae bacterium]
MPEYTRLCRTAFPDVTYKDTFLEHVKFEIAPCCVVEDEAGKEGEAGNLIWFPMQPDAASRRRKQQQAQSQV